MKSVFWLLLLAGLAVALALLVGNNNATVTVFWHPWRIDLSFNLVLAGLIISFVVCYLASRGIAILRGLPAQARRYRGIQQERAIYVLLLDAVVHQLSGRFVRAQSAAQDAARLLATLPAGAVQRCERWQVLAHLLVAESARSLGQPQRQQEALQTALREPVGQDAVAAQEAVLLRATSWALDQRDAGAARLALSRLPQGAARRIQAVRLRLRLAQLDNDDRTAIDMVRLLTKHRAFSPDASATVLSGLLRDALEHTTDESQLLKVWRRFEAGERRDPHLALVFLERLYRWVPATPTAGGIHAPAPWAADVRAAVEAVWSAYATLSDQRRRRWIRWFEDHTDTLSTDPLAHLEAMLQSRPTDAELMYVAGQVLLRRQLWGKATQLLTQASRQLTDADLLRRTWCSLAVLAEQRGDTETATACWRRAAMPG